MSKVFLTWLYIVTGVNIYVRKSPKLLKMEPVHMQIIVQNKPVSLTLYKRLGV